MASVAGEESISHGEQPSGKPAPVGRVVALVVTVVMVGLACVGVLVKSTPWDTHESRRSDDLVSLDAGSSFAETSFPWLHIPGKPLRLNLLQMPGTDVTHVSTIGHGGVEFGSPNSWHNKPARGEDPTLNAEKLMKQVYPLAFAGITL